MKKETPRTKIVVCEPDNSQILASGVAQERLPDGSPAQSHPGFRPHLMQGWSPDFIPKLTEDVISANLIDLMVPVSGKDALRRAVELAQKEGILAGISGGATLAGALAVCETLPKGANVLCMLPDTGERYLSTPLFADIAVDMTAEEIELSRSTPRYRFDVTPPAMPSPKNVEEDAPVTEQAEQYVKSVIEDTKQPVMIFALEWCEFCWSVRKLFAHCCIPYRSIDLDSVEFQKENWGGQIRAALKRRTSSPTIPQIFIGGEHIGGCTETFDAFNDGRLQRLLGHNGISMKTPKGLDAYSFLPSWLQPRA